MIKKGGEKTSKRSRLAKKQKTYLGIAPVRGKKVKRFIFCLVPGEINSHPCTAVITVILIAIKTYLKSEKFKVVYNIAKARSYLKTVISQKRGLI